MSNPNLNANQQSVPSNQQDLTNYSGTDVKGNIESLLTEVKRLSKESKDNLEETKQIKKEVRSTTELVLVGYVIMLGIIATLVWTAFTDWRHSGEDAIKQLQNDQYQLQQNEIDFLQKEATISASRQ